MVELRKQVRGRVVAPDTHSPNTSSWPRMPGKPTVPELPEGYHFRLLKLSDFTNQYVETLKVLTTVGDIDEAAFSDLYSHWLSLPNTYQPHVITNAQDVVVATGMLLLERKLIHLCGKVGHIEDIAVAATEQGKNLGRAMISKLTKAAENAGCYKVILDCSAHNVGFYEKCGYANAGVEMTRRFDH